MRNTSGLWRGNERRLQPNAEPSVQQSHPEAYKSWLAMRQRCLNPAFDSYPSYGGRGIGICERWDDFANFAADMGERPPGKTIERKNGALGYSPENCEWRTQFEQNQNLAHTRKLTHDGKTLSVSEWAQILPLSRKTISLRIERGWDVARALTQPQQTKTRRKG